MRSLLSVYNLVRLYLHFILTMSLEECQTKSFWMNLLLHAIFRNTQDDNNHFQIRAVQVVFSCFSSSEIFLQETCNIANYFRQPDLTAPLAVL